jgi:bacillithiol system protein YtxJ
MQTIDTIDALDAVLAGTTGRPALIFKHSLSCGTSAMAMEEMLSLMADPPQDVDAWLVRIQATRTVSDAIETRLKIRHESPQVLLVRDGRVVWSAAHFRVTADAVRRAIVNCSTSGAGTTGLP